MQYYIQIIILIYIIYYRNDNEDKNVYDFQNKSAYIYYIKEIESSNKIPNTLEDVNQYNNYALWILNKDVNLHEIIINKDIDSKDISGAYLITNINNDNTKNDQNPNHLIKYINNHKLFNFFHNYVDQKCYISDDIIHKIRFFNKNKKMHFKSEYYNKDKSIKLRNYFNDNIDVEDPYYNQPKQYKSDSFTNNILYNTTHYIHRKFGIIDSKVIYYDNEGTIIFEKDFGDIKTCEFKEYTEIEDYACRETYDQISYNGKISFRIYYYSDQIMYKYYDDKEMAIFKYTLKNQKQCDGSIFHHSGNGSWSRIYSKENEIWYYNGVQYETINYNKNNRIDNSIEYMRNTEGKDMPIMKIIYPKDDNEGYIQYEVVTKASISILFNEKDERDKFDYTVNVNYYGPKGDNAFKYEIYNDKNEVISTGIIKNKIYIYDSYRLLNCVEFYDNMGKLIYTKKLSLK